MSRQTKHFYEFDDFRLDTSERVLWRGRELVPLTQKAFEVLLALVESNNQLVKKDELMRRVWPDSFVEDGNLTQNIHLLRKALGRAPDGDLYIRNVPRRGYRFVAGVSEWRGERNGAAGREQLAGGPGESAAPEAHASLPPGDASLTAATDHVGKRAIEPAAPADANRRRNTTRFVVLGALSAVVAVAAVTYVAFRERAGGGAAPDEQVRVSALTTSGNVTCAAVSPDGRYVAYAIADNPRQSSLWIEEHGTNARRTVVPPTEIRYHALTFAPDGGHIYYVAMTNEDPMRRTLYRVSVLGGPAQKLLEDVQTTISFAPDGTKFVFRRGLDARRESALFVASVDGGEKEITTVKYPEGFNDPVWSPDGRIIACAAGSPDTADGMRVVAVSVTDGAARDVSVGRWRWIGQMAWLAGASELVMTASERSHPVNQIWRVSVADGQARRLTNDSNVYNRLSLAAAPGVLIALQVKQTSNVWTVTGDGRARQITFGAGGYRGGVAWAPGDKILYESESGSARTLSLMDADGNRREVLPIGRHDRTENLGNAVATPDGRYVIYSSDVTGERHVWRVSMDGGAPPVRLTAGGGEDHPHVSPDGRWVVYTNLERAGAARPTLGRVALNDSGAGGEAVRLTEDFTTYPVISPDGRQIACLRADGPGLPYKIAVYDHAGGAPRIVFPQHVGAQIVRWTPDGRGLTYAENPIAGASKIWIQPLGGGPPEQFAEFETDRIFGLDWAPDGRRLVCVRGFWATNVVLFSGLK